MMTRARLTWVLVAMFLLNTMNYVDRLMFGVAQELIKKDLNLSDFQLGLLGGPAFAILYILAAFPIARVAEQHSRVTIISLAVTAWSAMTALSGMVTSFAQMLVARAGVSIGEAGCAPPSHSLIADMFPPARRTSAMSVYGVAGPIGSMLAAIVGARLAGIYGWRPVFIGCGIIGVVIAVVFRLTVREPHRTRDPQRQSVLASLALLLRKRSFVAAAAAGGVAGFASYSNHQYMVSFLMRVHDMTVADAGLVLGISTGGVGTLMTLLTGPLIEGGRRRFPTIRTWFPALGLVWCGVFYASAFLAPTGTAAIACILIASFGMHFYMPALYTLAQDVAPNRMRATAAALMIGIISLIGYGIGPPAIGLMSDWLGGIATAAHGTTAADCALAASAACSAASADGLRLSLSIGSGAFLLAGLLFWLSGRTIEADLER